MLIIVSMECHTGSELGSGLILRVGRLDPYVKKIVIVWMATVIKKQRNAYLAEKSRNGTTARNIRRNNCIKYLKHWLKKLCHKCCVF